MSNKITKFTHLMSMANAVKAYIGQIVEIIFNAIEELKEENLKAISGKEDTSNKITVLSSESTDSQYPSAKAVYDKIEEVVGDISALLDTL